MLTHADAVRRSDASADSECCRSRFKLTSTILPRRASAQDLWRASAETIGDRPAIDDWRISASSRADRNAIGQYDAPEFLDDRNALFMRDCCGGRLCELIDVDYASSSPGSYSRSATPARDRSSPVRRPASSAAPPSPTSPRDPGHRRPVDASGGEGTRHHRPTFAFSIASKPDVGVEIPPASARTVDEASRRFAGLGLAAGKARAEQGAEPRGGEHHRGADRLLRRPLPRYGWRRPAANASASSELRTAEAHLRCARRFHRQLNAPTRFYPEGVSIPPPGSGRGAP